MKYWLFILLPIAFLTSCGDDESEFEPVYDVPAEFQPFVSSFFEIAESKGLVLDTNNLIIRFEQNLEVDELPVCGTSEGPLNSIEQHLILIDEQCLAWRGGELAQEILMFHELGHVFLERVHDETVFPSGDYKTIMFGGNWNILRFYTQDLTKREYYINELFNPLEPTPDWAE